MKNLFFAFLFTCYIAVSGQVAGDIVITEIMQNPSAVSDTNGEYFEIFNPTDDPIDINGWLIKDNGTDAHTISNGGPLLVPSGGYLVLARNSDENTNGGLSIDYQYSSVVMGNADDELILETDGSVEVDRVEWDNGVTFPDPTGVVCFFPDHLHPFF